MTKRSVHPAAISAIAVVTVLLITQFVLPGQGAGRGTPAAIVFSGLVAGSLSAVTAVGIVLLYRTTRIINFAQTAIGAAGGQLTFQLLELTKMPFVLALLMGLALAGLVGLIFDLVIGRRFFRAPRLVLTVATIATAGVLASLSSRAIQALPFLPKTGAIDQLLSNVTLRPKLPFHAWTFQIGSLPLQFGFPELLALCLSAGAIATVAALLKFTKIGVGVRAYSENLERSELLGIGTGSLSSIVWIGAGVLSGVGVILTGLVQSPAAATGTAPSILLPALAAAVLARMESLGAAALAAVVISIASSAFMWSYKQDSPVVSLALFVVVAAGLLFQRRGQGRSDLGAGVSWEASTEQRAIPRELASLPVVRFNRLGLICLALAFVGVYPWLASTGGTVLGSVIAVSTIVGLSVMVLTGWAGQVSLGQYGLAAVGAVVGGALMSKAGIPFWFSAPVAVACTAGFAVLIGMPALRIRGLFLGVTTFAFAVAASTMLFDPRYFSWLLPSSVNRPTLFLINFDDERAMYYLCVAALVASVVFVTNLRHSRFGRMLIATRENEANVEAFGVSAVRIKLLGFAVSGGLAGLAGVLTVTLLRGPAPEAFAPQHSIDVFLMAVLGGVSSVPGILLGSAYFNITGYFFTNNVVFSVLAPFAVILLLFVEPTGLIGLLHRLRDGVLRIIAQRRQLIVPSLFADVDERSLARRLIALGELIPGAGLSVLGFDESFAFRSQLYIGASRTVALDDNDSPDTNALAAAAASATDDAEPVDYALTGGRA